MILIFSEKDTEILHTEVNENIALKFFTALYFSENHPSAIELDHGILQRHKISAKALAH